MRCSRTLIEEQYRRTFANSLGKVQGVPIGKPDAAMRLRFADLFRVWCPMDSITRLGEIDPDQADRIVGTRRDGKFFMGPHPFEFEPRVVVIGGVLHNLPNAVRTAWCWLLAAADRCRIERHQFVIAPERTNDLCWLVNLKPGYLPVWPGID